MGPPSSSPSAAERWWRASGPLGGGSGVLGPGIWGPAQIGNPVKQLVVYDSVKAPFFGWLCTLARTHLQLPLVLRRRSIPHLQQPSAQYKNGFTHSTVWCCDGHPAAQGGLTPHYGAAVLLVWPGPAARPDCPHREVTGFHLGTCNKQKRWKCNKKLTEMKHELNVDCFAAVKMSLRIFPPVGSSLVALHSWARHFLIIPPAVVPQPPCCSLCATTPQLTWQDGN